MAMMILTLKAMQQLQRNLQWSAGAHTSTSVVQSRVSAFDLNKTLDENIVSELRIEYGEHYWDLHDLLGRSTEYAVQVD